MNKIFYSYFHSEEEAVLDKEQKLMKSFGFMDNRENLYNVQSMLPSSHVPPGFMGQFNHSYVPPPRFPEYRRPRPRTPATPRLLLCFRYREQLPLPLNIQV
jgi:hypothetical protein